MPPRYNPAILPSADMTPETTPRHPTALRSLLEKFGLEPREADLYLVLLGIGGGRATEIAKAAGESRPYAYAILRALKSKGLVAEIELGRVIHFTAERPERLRELLKEEQDRLDGVLGELEDALPALRRLESIKLGRPRVTLLQGIAGMRQLYREAFACEFVAVFNPASVYQTFGESLPVLLLPPAKARRLRGRELIVAGPAVAHHLADHPRTPSYDCRVLPEGVTFPSDILVYGDVLALCAYDADQTIVRVENAAIAASFRCWFEVMWGACASRAGGAKKPRKPR